MKPQLTEEGEVTLVHMAGLNMAAMMTGLKAGIDQDQINDMANLAVIGAEAVIARLIQEPVDECGECAGCDDAQAKSQTHQDEFDPIKHYIESILKTAATLNAAKNRG